MPRPSSVFVLGLASILLFGACSDDETNSLPANAFVDDYCELLMPCCNQAGLSSNPSQCQAFLTASTSGATYDQAKGEQCLSAVRAASGQVDFCTAANGVLNDETCGEVFSGGGDGNVEPGGACETDSDCADTEKGEGVCLHYWKGDTAYQACMIVADGKLNSGPCIGTRDGSQISYRDAEVHFELGYICDKADGLYCDTASDHCAAMGAIGEPCSFYEPCADEMYCDAEGKCAARLPVDSACSGPYDDECVASAYCDEATKTCAAQLGDGATCTVSRQCQSGSCTNGQCEKAAEFGLMMVCAH